MVIVKLFVKNGCSLCDQALEDLKALQSDVPHRLETISIDGDASLRKKYGETVPVVEVGAYHLNAPFNRQDLQIALGAAQRGLEQDQMIDQSITEGSLGANYRWTKADVFSYWMSRHYLALINFIVIIYVSIPFLAPVLMKIGLFVPARIIYKTYGVVCHQLAFRSWFLFGDQIAYPRSSAGVKNLQPFEVATGISEQDYFGARSYEGDEKVGYKVALCERDVAIYLAILLFGLAYAITGRKFPPLHWAIWLVIGLLPIGLDGISQIISQPPFNILPYRESTPLLRTITGGLFGFTTAWFGYPYVEDSMKESYQYLRRKLEIIKKRDQAVNPSQS